MLSVEIRSTMLDKQSRLETTEFFPCFESKDREIHQSQDNTEKIFFAGVLTLTHEIHMFYIIYCYSAVKGMISAKCLLNSPLVANSMDITVMAHKLGISEEFKKGLF